MIIGIAILGADVVGMMIMPITPVFLIMIVVIVDQILIAPC